MRGRWGVCGGFGGGEVVGRFDVGVEVGDGRDV